VQQPKTTATLSLEMSSRAFSAKSGQFEAGATTTASTFLPKRPPCLLTSSTLIRTVSFSVDSLVSHRARTERRPPSFYSSWACAGVSAVETASVPAKASTFDTLRGIICLPFLPDAGGTNRPKGSWQEAGQMECAIESNGFGLSAIRRTTRQQGRCSVF